MTLLSLFMTSTGIFCFVPISQRLIESGIIPTSTLLVCPTARNEDKIPCLLAAHKVEDTWSETKEHHRAPSPLVQIPPYPEDDSCQHLATHATWSTGTVSPLPCSLAHSPNPLRSTPIDTDYDHESTSFVSDSTLCDNCNMLLRGEIPPHHIPSVIRALALFEARDRLSEVSFDECEVVALTNAFSMLRL